MFYRILLPLLFISPLVFSQTQYRFTIQEDVVVTIDHIGSNKKKGRPMVLFYALPNGNRTDQTMGKKMQPGDDWRFDIQHVRAQARYVAAKTGKRVSVIYLENSYRSWPQWKATHADYKERMRKLLDTVFMQPGIPKENVHLNGHSGGGRFIFSFIDAFDQIPSYIKRISFLDSNYGYDSVYFLKLLKWVQSSGDHYLNVFAYNDSVALYEGKPVVSATGGTWYRSHWMLRDLSNVFSFREIRNDSIIAYSGARGRIQFFLKTNPDRKIYHTQQVERNGLIHSVLCGTRHDSKGYQYYGKRAYEDMIE